MAEQVTTGFIPLGGLVGIALGLYGLAPAFFGARLKRLREAAASAWLGDDEAEGEDGFDQAFDPLVGSRRREHSLFGLPAAWRDPDPTHR